MSALRTLLSLSAVATLPVLAAACHHGGSSQAAGPVAAPANLEGVWAFDAEASRQAMGGGGGMGGMGGGGGRGGYGGRGGGMGGGRGGMGGGMGGMGGGGGYGGGRRQGGGRAPGDSGYGGPRMPTQLTIRQSDSSLTMIPDHGAELTLFFDGRPIEAQTQFGGTQEVFGRWEKKGYRVERHVGEETIVELYERSKDEAKLVVHTSLHQQDHETRQVTRVYDWVRRE